MPEPLDPIIGEWYRDRDNDLYFTVVAVDEEAGTVELQHFDGDLEELEMSEWWQHNLEAAGEPEDWTGPVDAPEPDEWESDAGKRG